MCHSLTTIIYLVCIYKAACKTWLSAGNYCYRYSSRSPQAWRVIIPPPPLHPHHTPKQLWQQADKGLHLSKHLFILHFINSVICLIYRFMDFKRPLNPLRDSSPCCASLRTTLVTDLDLVHHARISLLLLDYILSKLVDITTFVRTRVQFREYFCVDMFKSSNLLKSNGFTTALFCILNCLSLVFKSQKILTIRGLCSLI